MQKTNDKKVVCPICGKEGIVSVDKFKVKGKTYYYLVIRHYEDNKTRRCIIKRISVPLLETHH
ncbi:MAG: hypothetical protein JHC26_03260 [Thermofilum sp.]|jgi:uncharacterized Zn finger protein (UPF0148 family)|uniref:hypothetical protein n=1 Tax=Thermofilum sp. TaxID=1961369 RepID=UPI00258B2A1B|nr:hypothetical protein [Thermofilum sp.]MCI4408087.1 hypothetical protein [Thermofilum sp.]